MDFLAHLSQDLFARFTITGGAVAALTSIVSWLFDFLVSYFASLKKLRDSEAKAFERVLDSDDLEQLGRYLNSTLGRFTVFEYTTDAAVQDRVDKMLLRLTEFVGSDEKVESEIPGEAIPIERAGGAPLGIKDIEMASPKYAAELQQVATSFAEGEVWNGLARLRRTLEVRLREVAKSVGVAQKNLRSAGQILRSLRDTSRFPINTVDSLDYVIRVCNQGVHGFDVPQQEAELALSIAVGALAEIERFDTDARLSSTTSNNFYVAPNK